MLKKPITYTNFDGEEVTENFYFNLTKAEMLEMQNDPNGRPFSVRMQEIADTKNGAKIIQGFKEIIQLSYGERSDDGKRFIKSEEISRDFMATEAYSELFMELATNHDAAIAFIDGLIPRDIDRTELNKAKANQPKMPEDYKGKQID